MFKKQKHDSVEFFQTEKGKELLKQISVLIVENKRLKQRNEELEAQVIRLSAHCSELNEKIELNNIDLLTKEEENVARNLMSELSIFKGKKPSRYLYSIIDEDNNEVRIYTSQVKDIIKNLSKTVKEPI